MTPRLTDNKKKRIISDYAEFGSYRKVAQIHGVSATTVKKLLLSGDEAVQKCAEKKAQNTEDMISFLESRREKAQNFLDMCLETMPEKLQRATLNQIATAFGIVIDKYIKVQPDGEQGQQFTINIIGGDGLDE